MQTTKPISTWPRVRKVFNNLHLWMGIGSGLILFVVCLTGTIYTFNTEIQETFEPGKFKVAAAGQPKLKPEILISKVLDSLKGGKVLSLYIPENPGKSYQISIKKAEKKSNTEAGGAKEGTDALASQTVERKEGHDEAKKPETGEAGSRAASQARVGQSGPSQGAPGAGTQPRPERGVTYMVNPYTGAILGTTEGSTSEFMMGVFRMHRWLMLDTEVGRPIVGIATLIFTFIIITGLIIWFPQRIKSWKQGLKIRFSGNWKRINHDLHNTLGFYASFLLIIMCLTGLTWSFEWYKTGVNKMLGVYKSPNAKKEKPLKSAIPGDSVHYAEPELNAVLAIATKELPYNGDYRITFAQEPDGVLAITKSRNGFFAPAAGDKLQLDRYNAEVLKKEIFRDKPLNERIAGSIKALHVGNVYGTFSKILYFIASLIATSLPVTGTMIWINKLRKKPKKSSKPVTTSSQELVAN